MARRPFGPLLRRLRQNAGLAAAESRTDTQLLERFARQHDQTAFALLLERHGAMVLGVGQRVLGNRHDAEDIFQATFLVLARKAATIVRGEALGGWLYGVAYRLALKARAGGARRRQHEAAAGQLRAAQEESASHTPEWQVFLDEELQRLPGKYRDAVVLHHLEGRSIAEAAQQLGCQEGQLRGLLYRGRRLLHDRLRRRGVVLGVGVGSWSVLTPHLPAALKETTVEAALLLNAGESLTVVASAEVARLTRGALQNMMLFKLKALMVALVLVAGAFGTGAMTLRVLAPAADAKPPEAKCRPAEEKAKPRDTVQVPSRRDGFVQEVLVKERDEVKEGQALARLDDRLAVADLIIEEAKLKAALADAEAAVKTRDEAEKRYDTIMVLRTNGGVTEEAVRAAKLTWERYTSEADSKKQAIEIAKQELEKAKIILDMYTIRSPVAGVVRSVEKQKGEAVKQYETVIVIRRTPPPKKE